MILISCDPGLEGAFCIYDTKLGSLVIHDLPTYERQKGKTKRRVVDETAIINMLTGFQMLGATHFIIEEVQGLPRQSAPAAFSFGYGYGTVLTVARMLGFQIEKVRPETWKAKLRVPADKNQARARASEMIPTHTHVWPLVKHSGRAEAALIGIWAQQHFEGRRK